jgi:hypothetical protein
LILAFREPSFFARSPMVVFEVCGGVGALGAAAFMIAVRR